MPAGRSSRKVPIYFRVSAEAAARIRRHLADYAGKPHYLRPGTWAEAVLIQAIEAFEDQHPEAPPEDAPRTPAQTRVPGTHGIARRLNHVARLPP